MNLVGKIFVFLIFCMSAVFVSFAVVVYAVHTNWRDEVMREAKDIKGNQSLGLKWQLVHAQEDYAKLQRKNEDLQKQLAAEVAAIRQNLAKAEATNTALQAQLAESEKHFEDLQQVHGTALIKVAAGQERFNVLQAENTALRGYIAEARQKVDDWLKVSVVRTDQANQAVGTIARLEERQKALVDQAAQLKKILDANRISISDPINAAKSTVAHGVVLAVKKQGEETYVQLSIGSDDNIQVGFPLEVYRGSKYVGQVVVVRTEPDKSAARAVRQVAPIEARDRVMTRAAMQTSS